MTPDSSRRALLASLALLAGCGSTRSGDDAPRTVADRLEGTPTRTSTPGPSPTAEPTPAAEPTPTAEPPGESRFAGRACPPVLDACYHGTSNGTPVFVRPSRERVELGGEVTMWLVNRGGGELFFGPYYWTVWRETDDGWTNADDRRGVADLGAVVPPGGAYEWTVSVAAGGDVEMASDRAAAGVDFRPGLYCFGVREVPLSSGGSPEGGTVGALFEVVESARE